jgi:hypothetical protein
MDFNLNRRAHHDSKMLQGILHKPSCYLVLLKRYNKNFRKNWSENGRFRLYGIMVDPKYGGQHGRNFLCIGNGKFLSGASAAVMVSVNNSLSLLSV